MVKLASENNQPRQEYSSYSSEGAKEGWISGVSERYGLRIGGGRD